MNKIKRAIIMASGLGTRLRPLTLTVPKPLLKVGEVVMIESIIDGLLANSQHLARLYERKLTTLDDLKISLLHKAFSGELTSDTVQ